MRTELLQRTRSTLSAWGTTLPAPVDRSLRKAALGFLTWVPPRFRGHPPRRFHAFGLGAPRSGTTSLASLFAPNYSAAREAEHEPITKLLDCWQRGSCSSSQLRRALRARDNRTYLEMDAACQLAPMAGQLKTLFFDAKFVLLIRDVYTWLESMLSKSVVARLRDYDGLGPWLTTLLQPEKFDYCSHDEPLRALGCAPLDAYLSYFKTLNEAVLSTLPADRLLVVRTPDLLSQAELIARFVGADPRLLNSENAHKNRTLVHHGALRRLEMSYVEDRARHFAGDLMQRFYPGLVFSHELLPPVSSTLEKQVQRITIEKERAP